MVDVQSRARKPQERSIETRKRILEATLACIEELGYAATTTVAVQEHAQVSRGRLLHHFPNREQLIAAAVAYGREIRLAEMLKRAKAVEGREDRLDAVIDAMWGTLAGGGSLAVAEMWLACRYEPYLKAVLEASEPELVQTISGIYSEAFGGEISNHPRFADVFEILVNAMRGATLLRAFDDAAQREQCYVEQWKRMARFMLSS